jgi:glyoxylate reductase
MKAKVFVTRKIPDSGLKMIKYKYSTNIWDEDRPPNQSEIIENAKDCTGLVSLLSDDIDSEVIKAIPNLKIIAQYAVGYDNIDIEYATMKGIMVTNTPGVLTQTTADLTWALILAASRRIVEADQYVRGSRWKVAWGPQMLLGHDIYGSKLGIVGMGRIGSAVARRAVGFSMKIVYTSRSVNERTRAIEQETGAIRTNLETLLREADIISLHVPLNSETNRMIGREQFALMKPDSILINTARGHVVDEDALINALESGKIYAAGLDVFEQEPIPMTSKLLEFSNVILTPHIGSASVITRNRMAEICARNLIAALDGNQPPNLVNPRE